ncbi:MAG: DUF3572 family protein [Pseudomonadota bacterium]
MEIGQSALVHLAGRPEDLGGFLGASGLDAGAVRERASDPEFLGFVLDYLMSDDALAESFCLAEELSAEQLAAARAALPGGDAPFWL